MGDVRPYLQRIVDELTSCQDGPLWEDCDAAACDGDGCDCPEEIEDDEPSGVVAHDLSLCICSLGHIQRALIEAQLALKATDLARAAHQVSDKQAGK